jgi:hypothetical protein
MGERGFSEPFVVRIGPFDQGNAPPGGESLPAGVWMRYGMYALPLWSAMLMLRVTVTAAHPNWPSLVHMHQAWCLGSSANNGRDHDP